MRKAINILLYTFLGLTVFLVAVHLKKVEYYINIKSNDKTIDLFSESFKCTAYLNRDYNNDFKVQLSFHHIDSDFQIIDLFVNLDNLELIGIEPYHGMSTSDKLTYSNFYIIPDTLKNLTKKSNPYFAFDHIFRANDKCDNFHLIIKVKTNTNGEEKIISEDVVIVKNSKIELRPWDMHSDFSFLFIPLFGLISFILIIVKLIAMIYRKMK